MIRFGVIGPGRAGARFAQGLTVVPGASLACVWGRNPERARTFADRFQVPHTAASIDELLSAPIDAVYIATHPDTHAALSIRALARAFNKIRSRSVRRNVLELVEGLAETH